MTFVERPPRDKSWDRAKVNDFEEDVHDALEELEEDPATIYSVYRDAINLAYFRTAIDPEVDQRETWGAWKLAMEISYALLKSSFAHGNEAVGCSIGGRTYRIPYTGPQYYSHVGIWLECVYLCFTCRDQYRLQELCEISIDELRAVEDIEGTRIAGYVYEWAKVLQVYIIEGEPAELFEYLTLAFQGSDPENVDIPSSEYLNRLVFPVRNSFRLYLERKVGDFNEVLSRALELHRRYFTANDVRMTDTEGIVSVPLLGIVSRAYDLAARYPQFEIDVESDYIPTALADGRWVGESP